MSATSFRLARLSRMERQVIESLRAYAARAEPPGNLLEGARAALASLASAVRRQGYEVRPVNAMLLTGDEARLIGWLALCQRDQPDILVPIDPDLEDLLARAANALKPGHLLPYQAVLRAGFVASDRARPSRSARGDGRPFEPPRRKAGKDTASARAIAYVRAHGRVSTSDLCATGLSHQYLSILCHKGDLLRVRHGYYEAPPSG